MSALATTCRPTVLYLEDDPRDVRLVQGHLALQGIECEMVCVEREADFRAAIERGGVDVILADQALPGFDGTAALALARAVCPDVPFISVSGSLGEEQVVEALKNGASDYVLKHSLTRLGPAVQRALKESLERRKRRQAEAEVRALEAQLRHSQKLEAVGHMAGGIAHDFNNLLTVINGYCERVLTEVDADGPVRADLDLIYRAGQRAAGLTRQLLAFSRRQILQPRIVHLNEIVADIERILKRVLGEKIVVSTNMDPTLGSIQADPGQIEQVLINLAINARDAMPDGGVISIETSNTRIGATDALPLRPGAYVALVVRDTGHGMDDATAARAFEPFFTTKDSGKGTGLGLSTVYGIVTQSGGHIAIDSALGRGTTMRVSLPRVDDGGSEQAAVEVPGLLSRGHETLLLVEDEDFVRELIREFLQSAGYTVLEARSAEDALELVKESTPMIDLLVTDMILPGLNGARLAERLRELFPRLTALYVSGYPGDDMFAQCAFDPGPAFLPKPFTRHLLTRKVREVLNARPSSLGTVLVSDPDEAIRRLLTHMLSRAGYDVTDRFDAAVSPGPHRPHVDVALIDIGAADPARWSRIRSLRTSQPQASIVLMAGSFGEACLRDAADVGVEMTLQKPLHESTVLDALRRAVAGSRRA